MKKCRREKRGGKRGPVSTHKKIPNWAMRHTRRGGDEKRKFDQKKGTAEKKTSHGNKPNEGGGVKRDLVWARQQWWKKKVGYKVL